MNPEHGNYAAVLERGLRLGGERPAVQEGGTTRTYTDLARRTRAAAGLLHELGVGVGDRVLLLMDNDVRFPELLLGVLWLGAVAVPVNTRLGTDALTHIAADSRARVLVAPAEHAAKLRGTGARTRIGHVVGPDGTVDGTTPRAAPADLPMVPRQPEDLAMQMYTSGSTGKAKGCLLPHRALWWQSRTTARTMLLEEDDAALAMGPLYHANALWNCLQPMLYMGGRTVVAPRFVPAEVLAAIRRHRPTLTSGTPSMFRMLLEECARTGADGLDSLEVAVCGSSVVPPDLLDAIQATFGCEVVEGYGLTEGGANLQNPRWGVHKAGSCGLPLPGVTVRVASLEDPDQDCAPGEVGELWSRSPANALGYHNRPDATAERFTADGWLRTGDLMRRDDQGYLYFAGRADDRIDVGGENVYPREVENVLVTHPGVGEVCVVGVPHRRKGAAPVAWVTRTPGAEVSEAELKEFFLAAGPPYAHPRRVFFLEELPVSGTGKVDRTLLTRWALEALPGGALD